MFRVDSKGNITLVAGDTGSFSIGCDEEFGANDRAIFSVLRSDGTIVLTRYYELRDGEFEVVFYNATTDKWPAGAYTYQVRYIVNPIYDDGGRIIDGSIVNTGTFDEENSVTRSINIIQPIEEV